MRLIKSSGGISADISDTCCPDRTSNDIARISSVVPGNLQVLQSTPVSVAINFGVLCVVIIGNSEIYHNPVILTSQLYTVKIGHWYEPFSNRKIH
jgi:hypothetical protein